MAVPESAAADKPRVAAATSSRSLVRSAGCLDGASERGVRREEGRSGEEESSTRGVFCRVWRAARDDVSAARDDERVGRLEASSSMVDLLRT